MPVRHLLASVLLAPTLLTPMPAWAQQEDAQLWLQVNTSVPLAERWRVTLEQIGRVSDRQDGLFQTEFGGILGWKVADGVELGFGYRKVGFHSANTAANEDRMRQQVVASFGVVTTRLRVDQRFHPGGNEIGVRVRPLVRYNHKIGGKGVALFASHESFWLPNATRWGQRSGYERMRNIAGVALPLGRQLAADVGYLNQYRFGRDGARDQMDHALTLQLSISVGGGTGESSPRADD